MPDQILPITGLDQTGVIYDTPPVSLPPNAFTDVRNMRFRDGAARKMEGEINIFPWQNEDDNSEFWNADDRVRYVAWWPNPNLAASNSGYYLVIVREGGDTPEDVAYIVDPVGRKSRKGVFSPNGNWQHTFFQGGFALIINNGLDVPHFILDPDGNTYIGDNGDVTIPAWTTGTAYNVGDRVKFEDSIYTRANLPATTPTPLPVIDTAMNPTQQPEFWNVTNGVPQFAPLPGWESYESQEVILSDTFTDTSSRVFDTQREVDFNTLQLVVERIRNDNNGVPQTTVYDQVGGITEMTLTSGSIRLGVRTGAQTELNYNDAPLAPARATGFNSHAVVVRGNQEIDLPGFALITDSQLTFTSFTFQEGDTILITYQNYAPDATGYQLFRDPDNNNYISIVFPDNTMLTTNDVVRVIERSREPVNVRAGVVRAFGDFLVAGNLVERAEGDLDSPILRSLVGVVRSSDVAAPGSIPQNWNPFAAGVSTADEFVITADGIVQDMAELQGNLYIYSNSSISVMTQTGNPQTPLAVRPVTDSYGCQTTDAVLEFDGKHIVVGSEDIYLFGGNPGGIQSISDGRVRHRFFDRLNPLHEENTFIIRYQQRDEIWICIPSVDSVAGECDEAYIWNYRLNNWTVRDLEGVIAGDVGPLPGGGIPSTLVDLDGASGDNGVTNIGATEVQALTFAGDLPLGDLKDFPNGRTEEYTITVGSFMDTDGTTRAVPSFNASERETFDVVIPDDWDTGPNSTEQQSTLTIPDSSFVYSPEFRSSGAELFLNWNTPADNPENSQATTLITATQLYATTALNATQAGGLTQHGVTIALDSTAGIDQQNITLTRGTAQTFDGVVITPGNDSITAENTNTFPVVVTYAGRDFTIQPGQTTTLDTFTFDGTTSPQGGVTASVTNGTLRQNTNTTEDLLFINTAPGVPSTRSFFIPLNGVVDVVDRNGTPVGRTVTIPAGGATLRFETGGVGSSITSINGARVNVRGTNGPAWTQNIAVRPGDTLTFNNSWSAREDQGSTTAATALTGQVTTGTPTQLFNIDFTNTNTVPVVLNANSTNGAQVINAGQQVRVQTDGTGRAFRIAGNIQYAPVTNVRVRTPGRTTFTATNRSGVNITSFVINGATARDLANNTGVGNTVLADPITDQTAPTNWSWSGTMTLVGRVVAAGTTITNETFLADLSTAINADLIPSMVWANTTVAGQTMSLVNGPTAAERGPRRIRPEAGVFRTYQGTAPTTISQGTVANPICPTVFPFESTVSGVRTRVVEDGTRTVTNTISGTTDVLLAPGVTARRVDTPTAPTFGTVRAFAPTRFPGTGPAFTTPEDYGFGHATNTFRVTGVTFDGNFSQNGGGFSFQGTVNGITPPGTGYWTGGRGNSAASFQPVNFRDNRVTNFTDNRGNYISFPFTVERLGFIQSVNIQSDGDPSNGPRFEFSVEPQTTPAGTAFSYTVTNNSGSPVTVNGTTVPSTNTPVTIPGAAQTLTTTTVVPRYTITVENTRTRELDDEIDGFQFFNNGTRVDGPREFMPEDGVRTVATQVDSPKYSWTGTVPTVITETFTETGSNALIGRGITAAVSTVAGGGVDVTGSGTGTNSSRTVAGPAPNRNRVDFSSNQLGTYTVTADDAWIFLAVGGGDPDRGTTAIWTIGGTRYVARDGNQTASIGVRGPRGSGAFSAFRGFAPSLQTIQANAGDVIEYVSGPRNTAEIQVYRQAQTTVTDLSGSYTYTPPAGAGALVIENGRPLSISGGNQLLRIEPPAGTRWYLSSGNTDADNFAIAQGAVPLPNGTGYTVAGNRTINFTLSNTNGNTGFTVNASAYNHTPSSTGPGNLQFQTVGTAPRVGNWFTSGTGGNRDGFQLLTFDADTSFALLQWNRPQGTERFSIRDGGTTIDSGAGSAALARGPAWQPGDSGLGRTAAQIAAAPQLSANGQISIGYGPGNSPSRNGNTGRAIRATVTTPAVNVAYGGARRITLTNNNEEPITGGSLTFGGNPFPIPDPWNPGADAALSFDSQGTNQAFSFTGTRSIINEGESVLAGSIWANQSIGSLAGPTSPQLSFRITMPSTVATDPAVLDEVIPLSRNQTVANTTGGLNGIRTDLIAKLRANANFHRLFETVTPSDADDGEFFIRARAVPNTPSGAAGYNWPGDGGGTGVYPDHDGVMIEFASYQLNAANDAPVTPFAIDTGGSGATIQTSVFGDRRPGDAQGIIPPIIEFHHGPSIRNPEGVEDQIQRGMDTLLAVAAHGNFTPTGAANALAHLVSDGFDESPDWNTTRANNVVTVTSQRAGPFRIEPGQVVDMNIGTPVGATGLDIRHFQVAETRVGIAPTTGPNAVPHVLPTITITDGQGAEARVTLTNASETPLTFEGIWNQLLAPFAATTGDFADWTVAMTQLPSGYTQFTGNTNRRLTARIGLGAEAGIWNMTVTDYGNVGLGPAGSPHPWVFGFMNSRGNTGTVNGLTIGPANDFRGAWTTYASPTYMGIRVRNPLLNTESLEEVILLRIGARGDYDIAMQTGTNGLDKMVAAEAMSERFQAALQNITRNLVVTDAGSEGQFLIQPAVYSDLANFVLDVRLNDSVGNAGIINGWLEDDNLFKNPRNSTVLRTTEEPGVALQVTQATNSPDRVTQTGWSQATATRTDTRRPDAFGQGVTDATAMGSPDRSNTVVDSVFDVFRPWPATQVNFNQQYPLFASTVFVEESGQMGQTRPVNKILGADIGWTKPTYSLMTRMEETGNVTVDFDAATAVTFSPSPTGTTRRIAMGTNDFPIPYTSYIERVQMGMTPEFDTEETKSVALWADGATQQTFQAPSERNRITVRMLGTNNPGQMVDLSAPMEQKATNLFPVGHEYKSDLRIHGRFMNFRITDAISPEQETELATIQADERVVFGQNAEWRVSGMQVEIKKGGTR